MREYDYTTEREMFLEDSIKELQKVNRQLAKLNLRKEELTTDIIGILGHQHEGQKTHVVGMWKLEVKTPCTYSLNKELYTSGTYFIPDSYNPIKESVSYTIDKKRCDELLNSAPADVREMLITLIDKKAGKASITIKENV